MPVRDELAKMVKPECLGIAMISQTAFILSVTATTWTLMYFYSPSRSLRMRFPGLNNAYMSVERFIQNRVDALPHSIRSSKKVDWNRVVTSGAEAWIIRKPLIPFTYSGSIAFGVFCGSRFYNWRYGVDVGVGVGVEGDDYMIIDNNNNKETVFGWNKIEHGPSTDDWELKQYEK